MGTDPRHRLSYQDMTLQIKRHKEFLYLLVAILIAFAAFLFTYKGVRIVYAINDDITIRSIASGSLSGTPDGHLIYIQYALGWIISRLYLLDRRLDWYGLVMLGLLHGCLSLVMFRVLELAGTLKRQVTGIALVLAAYALFGLQQAAVIQYTDVSGVLAGTAVFWLCTVDSRLDYRRFLDPAICLTLMLLSYMVRSSVLLMSLPFAALVFLYRNVDWPNRRIRLLVLPFGLLVGIAVVFFIEQAAYDTPEWKAFLRFNGARTQIFDYCGFPDYGSNDAFYRSIGVSAESYDLLSRYTFAPNVAANTRIFEAIAARCRALPSRHFVSSDWLFQSNEAVSQLFDTMLDGRYTLISTTCAVLFAFLIARRRSTFGATDAGFVLFILLLHLGIPFFLILRGRFPDRIVWALYLIELLLLAGFTLADNGFPAVVPNATYERTAAVIFLLVAAAAVDNQVQVVNAAVDAQATANKACERVYAYAADHPDNFYFLSTHSFEICTKTFSILADDRFANYTYMGDWDFLSPPLIANWRNNGMGDIQQDLVKRSDIFVVIKPPDSIDYLVNYYHSIQSDVVARDVEDITIGDHLAGAVYRLEMRTSSAP